MLVRWSFRVAAGCALRGCSDLAADFVSVWMTLLIMFMAVSLSVFVLMSFLNTLKVQNYTLSMATVGQYTHVQSYICQVSIA